jgi:hypothetical protein
VMANNVIGTDHMTTGSVKPAKARQ